jgi:5-methylcytosine-specific restriction endonuclease McrA
MSTSEEKRKRNEYRAKNRDKINQQRRARYVAHPTPLKSAEEKRRNTRATALRYYKENRRSVLAAKSKWRKAHAELVKQIVDRSREKHKDRILERARKWRKEHPDKTAAINKRWREKNREHLNAYRKSHPHVVVLKEMRRRERHAQGNIGIDKDAQRKLVNFIRTARRIACYWCNEPVPKKKRHIDHIIPLARGGTGAASNLCCACASCNLRKLTMMPHEFREKLARLRAAS